MYLRFFKQLYAVCAHCSFLYVTVPYKYLRNRWQLRCRPRVLNFVYMSEAPKNLAIGALVNIKDIPQCLLDFQNNFSVYLLGMADQTKTNIINQDYSGNFASTSDVDGAASNFLFTTYEDKSIDLSIIKDVMRMYQRSLLEKKNTLEEEKQKLVINE